MSNGSNGDAPEYTIEEEKIYNRLDPELQRVILDYRSQHDLPFEMCEVLKDGTEVVDIIAKLEDPGVRVNGLNPAGRVGNIITGTVDVNRIEEVRRNPNVLSLKAARMVRQALLHSVPEIEATPEQLLTVTPGNPRALDGSGVIVGIVDHGCDFTHPNFRKPDENVPGGATRVLYLWSQRGGTDNTSPEERGRSPQPYGYGREFNSDAINEALVKAPPTGQDPESPFRFLKYEFTSEHGTAVMDVATGNGGGGKHAAGVAPGADIIFVDASIGEDLDPGESFGNSRHLLEAVAYIFDKAKKLGRPAVVNISLNYEAGPHDGSTPVEEGFDRMLEVPGRAIVIAAGNSRMLQIHTRRTVHPRLPLTLRWFMRQAANNINKVEVWYGGGRQLSVILRSPRGHEIGPFRLDTTHVIYRKGVRAGYVFHRKDDPTNGENNFVILAEETMETGTWELDIRLLDDGSHLPIEIHAWTETDQQRSFFPDARQTDDACTLGTFGCGHSTLVVGAYNPLDPGDKVDRSGEGPTRDGKLKPELSAPGLNITAAKAKTASTSITEGGTSLAAPHVTGVVALLMQAALPSLLHVKQIRETVITAARDEPPSPEHAWDSCYGAGRISAVASLQALLHPPVPPDAQDEQVIFFEEETTSVTSESVSGLLNDGSRVALEKTTTESRMTLGVASVALNANGGGGTDNGEAGKHNGEGQTFPPPPPTKGH